MMEVKVMMVTRMKAAPTSGPVMAASHSKKFSSVTGPAAIPSGGFWGPGGQRGSGRGVK